MRPLIHIGYPKTATTWFQRNFYPYVNGIYLPHHNLVKSNIIGPFDLSYSQAKYMEDFRREANERRLVICEENLAGSLQNGGMQGYHTKETGLRLKTLFPEADIVIFIRKQPEMVASAYIQYVKGGGNYSLKTYLFDKQYDFSNSRMLFSLDFFRYDTVIEFYQSLFGIEKVHVFLFEEFAENNERFIKAFAEKFSLETDYTSVDFSFQNIRLRKGLIPLARLTNSFSRRPVIHKYYLIHIPFWYKLNKSMILYLNRFRIFGKYPEARSLLGGKIYNYLCNYYRESNLKLLKKYQLTQIRDYNYPV